MIGRAQRNWPRRNHYVTLVGASDTFTNWAPRRVSSRAAGDSGPASGRVVNFHAQLLQWLKNRLLLADVLTRHPEIHDIELLPPIVIAGLPRTGTTHLHNLLAAAPTFRTMPYWESNEPFPLRGKAGVEPDPRRARMDVAVQVVDIVMPHLRLMHEMTTDHVHEEIQLLANDFSTMLFETLGRVPRWRDYYMAHDQTSHYEFLKTQLKAMQFLRGADDGCSSRRSTSSSCRC